MARLRIEGLGAALALCLYAGAASPHAHLMTSDPAPGARLKTAPARVVLSFSEPLTLAFSGVSLGRAGAAAVPLAGAALAGPKILEAPLPRGLAPGAYVLLWRAVSTDSHRTEGRLAFTVEGPPVPPSGRPGPRIDP